MKLASSPIPRLCLLASTFSAVLALSGTAHAMVTYSNPYVSGVTTTGVASLNTTLDSTSSLTHTATFDFGTTSARGTTIAGSTGANNVTPFFQGNVSSVPITGLTCGTTYHWAVVVAGVPDNDQTFTTTACPAPVIGVSPTPQNYGPVAVGGAGQHTFTISNTGNANLVVSGITLGGASPGVFDIALGTCASLTPTIAAGNNCTVVVTFSPIAVGNKTTTLHVASNAGSTVDVALSGKGVAGGGSVPTLSEWGMIFLAGAFAVVLVLQSRQGVSGSPA